WWKPASRTALLLQPLYGVRAAGAKERLKFLLCCRCCQALLRIFSFLYFWTQSPIAQSHLSTSFDAQSSRLQCLSARASPETITAGEQCPTAEMRKTT